MVDDNTEINDGQVDDGQVDDNQTGYDDAQQTDSEFMEETVDLIKETQKAINDDDDSGSDDGGTDDSGNAELRGTDIPDAFTEAAEAIGMSGADIVAFADDRTDEELLELIPHLEEALKGDDDNTDDGKKDDKQDDKQNKTDDGDNKNIDPKLVEGITEKISKQLEEKFGATLEEIDKFKAHQKEQSAIQAVETASKIFDEASKEYPVFGKTEELPRFTSGRLAGQLIPTSPEMKARVEVLRFADAFIDSGANIEDAMANALATYKGLHLAKESQRNAIRDLKNHERTLSGARIGKETKKKYADSRDEIIDEIRQMQRAAGID